MSFPLSLRKLTENGKLKLAALGLAVLLWAVVSAEQETAQWLPARVEVVARDPAYVLAGSPEPAEVRVRVTGPGRELWSLAFDRPVVRVAVQEVDGRRSFAVDPSMVRLPAGVQGVRVLDVSPATVRLGFERLVTRDLPVRAQVAGQSSRRYVVDSLVILPPVVRVTGPAERLREMESLVTRAFEIVPDDSTFQRRVALDTASLRGLSLSSAEVEVSGLVDLRVERGFPGTAVDAPEGVVPRPTAVEVIVQGPERAVRAIDPTAVRVRVRADSIPAPLPPEGRDLPVVVEGLPRGATARTVPVRVHVSPAAPAPTEPDSTEAP